MANVFEGNYQVEGARFGIVVSRFNETFTKQLLEGALNELRRAGIQESGIQVVWVPGAYEIPLACQTLIETGKPDALVAIGCIVRGETSHYEHLAQTVTAHLQKTALEKSIPIGFGVLTVENMSQAIERSGGKHGNKGRDAARSALEMVSLLRGLRADETKGVLGRLVESEFRTS